MGTDRTVTAEWFGPNAAALQVDGNDVVHLTDVDDTTGDALVRVFASVDPEADVVFEGRIRLRPRMYARLTAGGTACAETALCAAHLDRAADHPGDRTGGRDAPVTAHVDASGNDALTCQECP